MYAVRFFLIVPLSILKSRWYWVVETFFSKATIFKECARTIPMSVHREYREDQKLSPALPLLSLAPPPALSLHAWWCGAPQILSSARTLKPPNTPPTAIIIIVSDGKVELTHPPAQCNQENFQDLK